MAQCLFYYQQHTKKNLERPLLAHIEQCGQTIMQEFMRVTVGPGGHKLDMRATQVSGAHAPSPAPPSARPRLALPAADGQLPGR